MQAIKNAFSRIKTGYDFCVAQIGIHPEITFWVGSAVVVALIVWRR